MKKTKTIKKGITSQNREKTKKKVIPHDRVFDAVWDAVAKAIRAAKGPEEILEILGVIQNVSEIASAAAEGAWQSYVSSN